MFEIWWKITEEMIISLIKKISLILCINIFLVGCIKVESVYTWKRNDTDLFELQYKIDENKRITLLTNYINNNHRDDKNSRILDYFGKCEFFDEKNWTCRIPFTDMEYIQMVDGQLIWYYWSEVRKYKKTYRLKY